MGDSKNHGKASQILVLVPYKNKHGMEEAVKQGLRPRIDVLELASRLQADTLDFDDVLDSKSFAIKTIRKLFGLHFALVVLCLTKKDKYGLFISPTEKVGIPLALFLKILRLNQKHLMISHYLSPFKKRIFFRLFKIDTKIDLLTCNNGAQRELVEKVLGISPKKIRQTLYHVDSIFFKPGRDKAEKMVCSVGLEFRDYETLIEAVKGLPVQLHIAAAYYDGGGGENLLLREQLPANVKVRSYNHMELRDLYKRANFAVVPLFENDFGAGVTAILESMAMAKPVIVSKTKGQVSLDIVKDGLNGIYVEPRNVDALRAAIIYLLDNTIECKSMGTHARKIIEGKLAIENYVQEFEDYAGQILSVG